MRTEFARKLGTVAPIALVAALGAPAFSGILLDQPLIEVVGDGFIFADPTEGVLEPGLKAITKEVNADWVKEGTSSPSGILNCLMANNPAIECDAPEGSGKRIKTRLTGRAGIDLRFQTSASEGITEYFTYGKTSNLTGARITGLTFTLGTGTGDAFEVVDATDPATSVLWDQGLIPRFQLPDGLFGGGGQEATGIGFFNDVRATMAANNTLTEITTAPLANDYHISTFGTAVLDNSMIPDGVFWDASTTGLPDAEPVLIAWYNTSAGGWVYGNLGTDTPPADADEDFATLDVRLAALADSLGVTVEDLGTTGNDGALIPDDIVALIEANGLFEVLPVEDLRNVNLNFMLDVGDIAGDEFTLRITPSFAQIVQEATSEYQFRTAGYLDGMANVPYLDIGNAAAYQAAITEILALDAAAQVDALEQTGFSFLGAFSGLGMNLGRDQVFALGRPSVEVGTDGVTLSSKGDGSWSMGNGLRGFASIHGSAGSYETTANSIGYDVDTRGFSAGVETAISPTLSVGVMVGGLDGTAKAFGGRGKVDTSGLSVAAYGRTSFGQGGSLQAVVGYQDLSFDTTRNVMGEIAEGSTDGAQTFMALQADYMFRQGALTWGPMASIERYDLSVDGFTETGAGLWNLAVGKQDGAVTLVSAGVRGDYALDAGTNTRAYGSVAMTKASGDDALIAAGFVGLPAGSTPVDGIDQDWVDVNLGLTTSVPGLGGKDAVLGGEYRGSFGDDYENHALGVFLKMAF